jgi:hypothetical protein
MKRPCIIKVVIAVAVGKRQRLYSGIRTLAFAWFYISPSSIKIPGWGKGVDLRSLAHRTPLAHVSCGCCGCSAPVHRSSTAGCSLKSDVHALKNAKRYSVLVLMRNRDVLCVLARQKRVLPALRKLPVPRWDIAFRAAPAPTGAKKRGGAKPKA